MPAFVAANIINNRATGLLEQMVGHRNRNDDTLDFEVAKMSFETEGRPFE